MTPAYALASACGELMERLCNKALFRDGLIYATRYFAGKEKLCGVAPVSLDYLYHPDERFCCVDSKVYWRELQAICPALKDLNCSQIELFRNNTPLRVIYANFWNTGTQSTESLPIDFIRADAGSTGMCAGNSAAEAILQGIYEIFERHVLQRIYVGRKGDFSMPVVPIDAFKGEPIYSKIHECERKLDVKAIVLDCSLGEGFPVLGLCLVKKDSLSWAFRLGADSNAVTALERCYTEMFQGDHSESIVFHPIERHACIEKKDYEASLRSGSGRWPFWVLEAAIDFSVPSINGLQKCVFPHQDFSSYDEELSHWLSILKEKGFSVYVRDNSFLGFPVFYIYIPRLSNTDQTLRDYRKLLVGLQHRFEDVPSLWRLGRLDENETIALASEMESREGIIVFVPWSGDRKNKTYPELLSAAAWISTGNWMRAQKALASLRNRVLSTGCKYPQWYVMLEEECKRLSQKEIPLCYSDNDNGDAHQDGLAIRNRVKSVLQHSSEALSDMGTPSCFHCDGCELFSSCAAKRLLGLELELQHKQALYNNTTEWSHWN
ncbi:MAG: YcaO-like family protein [Bacteroidales bacterium]|nr:YcaO-like family protein [Bacteroidales bacterium]